MVYSINKCLVEKAFLLNYSYVCFFSPKIQFKNLFIDYAHYCMYIKYRK